MAKDHRGREGRHRLKAPCGTALSGSPGSAGQSPAGHARYSMRVRRARLSERGWYRGSMAFRPDCPGGKVFLRACARRGGYHPPAVGLLPCRRRCEASRRRFRRRRRCETKRSDLGWRFSFFPRGRGRCAGPMLFLFLERKSIERKNRFPSLKGFWAPSPRITARIRSLWRSGGCYPALLTKPSV